MELISFLIHFLWRIIAIIANTMLDFKTLYSSSTNIMDSMYGGGWGGEREVG